LADILLTLEQKEAGQVLKEKKEKTLLVDFMAKSARLFKNWTKPGTIKAMWSSTEPPGCQFS
jgi:hypothetical protein